VVLSNEKLLLVFDRDTCKSLEKSRDQLYIVSVSKLLVSLTSLFLPINDLFINRSAPNYSTAGGKLQKSHSTKIVQSNRHCGEKSSHILQC